MRVLASKWRPNRLALSGVFSVGMVCKLLIFVAWGARGPGFKSRQPDQPFLSDAGDFIASREASVDDFAAVILQERRVANGSYQKARGCKLSPRWIAFLSAGSTTKWPDYRVVVTASQRSSGKPNA